MRIGDISIEDVSFANRHADREELVEAFPRMARLFQRARTPVIIAAKFLMDSLPEESLSIPGDYAARGVAAGATLLASTCEHMGFDGRFPLPHSGTAFSHVPMGNHHLGHNAEVAEAFDQWVRRTGERDARFAVLGMVAGAGHDAVQLTDRIRDEHYAAVAVAGVMDRFGFDVGDQEEVYHGVMGTLFLDGTQPLAGKTKLAAVLGSSDLNQLTDRQSAFKAVGLAAEYGMRRFGAFSEVDLPGALEGPYPHVFLGAEAREQMPQDELEIPSLRQIMEVIEQHPELTDALRAFWRGQEWFLRNYEFPIDTFEGKGNVEPYDETFTGRADNADFAAQMADMSEPTAMYEAALQRALDTAGPEVVALADQQTRQFREEKLVSPGRESFVFPHGLIHEGLRGPALHEPPADVQRVLDNLVIQENAQARGHAAEQGASPQRDPAAREQASGPAPDPSPGRGSTEPGAPTETPPPGDAPPQSPISPEQTASSAPEPTPSSRPNGQNRGSDASPTRPRGQPQPGWSARESPAGAPPGHRPGPRPGLGRGAGQEGHELER